MKRRGERELGREIAHARDPVSQLHDALFLSLMRALARVDLRARARDALAFAKVRGPCFVVCAGKASLAMSRGAADALADHIEAMMVVAPKGLALPGNQKHAIYMHAAHPLPDARSVRAAKHALALATRAKALRATLVVLLSGGASSLLATPIDRVSLEKKRQIIEALLRAGKSIADVNVVRRHLSKIKGGGLLRAAGASEKDSARVVTLLASDVLDDSPWDIGSGPSVFDPTTTRAARRVLHALGEIGKRVPLEETEKERPKEQKREKGRVDAPVIIASPSLFASEYARALHGVGFRARVLPPSDDRVENLAREYVQIASNLKRGECVVRAAEPRVNVPDAHGHGGRASHLAALVAANARLPDDVAFLAGATDGIDGSSNAAGAIVSRASFAHLDREVVRECILRFDTAKLHLRAKTAIFLGESDDAAGPSGRNFADVHALARAK